MVGPGVRYKVCVACISTAYLALEFKVEEISDSDSSEMFFRTHWHKDRCPNSKPCSEVFLKGDYSSSCSYDIFCRHACCADTGICLYYFV
jgi:hypothetical protein